MTWILTSDERTRLLAQHKGERDKRVADRIKAVLLCDEGYSYVDIARVLFLDEQTISRFVREYQTTQKLKPENGGSQSKLTDSQTQALCDHLSHHLYVKVKDICHYVEKIYEVTYSIAGMTYFLHHHGFSYKKPKGVPAKLDAVKQAEFF